MSMLNIKELRETCQPKRKIWLWRDKFVRGVSIYLTRLFLFTNISANSVTWIMLFMGIISAVFYSIGGYMYALIGLILHHLYFILDAVDGEVARYRRATSEKPIPSDRGVYLDLMTHIIVHPLIIMGIAIGVFFNNYTQIPDYVFLILGFAGSFSYMMSNFVTDKKYELLVKKGDKKLLKNVKEFITYDGTKINVFKEEIWFLISFEVFNLMFIFTLLNLLPFLVILYAALFTFNAVRKFFLEYKKIERVS